MIKRKSLLGTWLVACGTLVACSQNSRVGPEAPSPFAEARNVVVYIENQNLNDATVYYIRNQSAADRHLLGRVPGFATRRFSFPWSQGELAFQVNFLSGASTVTHSEGVDVGDTLNLVLTPDMWRGGGF